MGTIKRKLKFLGSKGESELLALFDTGASVSVIKETCADKLSIIDAAPNPFIVQTANTDYPIELEKRTIVDFHLEGFPLWGAFWVWEKIPYDVIIGADLMQIFHIIVAPDEDSVYFRDGAPPEMQII